MSLSAPFHQLGLKQRCWRCFSYTWHRFCGAVGLVVSHLWRDWWTAAPKNNTWSVGRAHNTCSLDFNNFLKACHPLSWTPVYMLLANDRTLGNNLPLAFGIHSFFKGCGQNQCTGCLRGKHLRWGAFLGKVLIFSEDTDFRTCEVALLWMQMDDLKPASYPACRWGRSPGEWGRLRGRGVPHDQDRFSAARRPNGTRSQGSGKDSLARWGWLTERGEWEEPTAWTQIQLPPLVQLFVKETGEHKGKQAWNTLLLSESQPGPGPSTQWCSHL